MIKKVDCKLPYLVKTKRAVYFVEYRAFNPLTNRFERFRYYKGFRDLKTENEINAHADKIKTLFREKLLSGWRPWDDKIFTYSDEIEYKNIVNGFGGTKIDSNHIRKHLSEFLSWKKSDISAKSYQSYQSKTRLFCLWLEKNNYQNLLIGEITNDIAVKFFQYLISERNLDIRTVAKYKQNLHSMFAFFKKKKLISEIPLEDLPRSTKKVDNAARPISDDHMIILLNNFSENNPQLLLASMFQLLTLARPNGELRLMKLQDVDLNKGVAFIKDDTAKTTKRVIIMPKALVEYSRQWNFEKYPPAYYIFGQGGKPGPKPVGVNFFNRHFSVIKKDLGLPDTYKFYSFKHTGAGKLMESGATLAELMSHLGHTKFESTISYVRRHFGEKSEKISNFKPDFLDGLKL